MPRTPGDLSPTKGGQPRCQSKIAPRGTGNPLLVEDSYELRKALVVGDCSLRSPLGDPIAQGTPHDLVDGDGQGDEDDVKDQASGVSVGDGWIKS